MCYFLQTFKFPDSETNSEHRTLNDFTRSTASVARCLRSRSSVQRGRRPIADGYFGHVTACLRATALAPSAENFPPGISV